MYTIYIRVRHVVAAIIEEKFEYLSVQKFPVKLQSFGVQPITVPTTQNLQLQQDITVRSQLHQGFRLLLSISTETSVDLDQEDHIWLSSSLVSLVI